MATARVNVEINLASITDAQASLEMIAEADKADGVIARAEQVTAAVREQSGLRAPAMPAGRWARRSGRCGNARPALRA